MDNKISTPKAFNGADEDVDSKKFEAWRMQVLEFLRCNYGSDSEYYKKFNYNISCNSVYATYSNYVLEGIEYLNQIYENNNNWIYWPKFFNIIKNSCKITLLVILNKLGIGV